MPVYEYQCDGCNKIFEVTQRITDDPLKKHAECGSKKVKRLISQTSFQLKGTGWYVTDYAGKKTSDESEASSSSSSSGADKKADGTGDGKTDAGKAAGAKADAAKVEPKEETRVARRRVSAPAPVAARRAVPKKAGAKAPAKPAKKRK